MFLTLDESTLFYWTLSDESHSTGEKRKHISVINKWASVVHSIKSSSQAPKSSSSHTRDDIPSLTSGTTSGRTYAPSILSENIQILSHQSSDAVKVKAKLAPEILVYNNGGLSDNDELTGEEQEVAIKSPPKGKKRMTSEVVSFFFSI